MPYVDDRQGRGDPGFPLLPDGVLDGASGGRAAQGLHGLPKADCPNPWHAIRDKWYLMLPLAVLVFMLFDGFTPMFSGIVGLALTAMLILGVGIASGFGSTLFRIVFWMVLGLGARPVSSSTASGR